MTSEDAVTVTTIVAVDPTTAFAIFTEEVDAWWKHGPRFRPGIAGSGVMRFEPRAGGRLLEVYDGAAQEPFELGRIRHWKPPELLAFSMGGRDLGPGEETEVEVRFEAAPQGTRVTIEHRGWGAFGPEHPARHGLVGEAFTSMMGLWWSDLLVSLQTTASRERSRRRPGEPRVEASP